MDLVKLFFFKNALSSSFKLNQPSITMDILRQFGKYLRLPSSIKMGKVTYPVNIETLKRDDHIFIQSYTKEILWHYKIGESRYDNMTGQKCFNILLLNQRMINLCDCCPVDQALKKREPVLLKDSAFTLIVVPFEDYILRIIKFEKEN